MKSSMREALAHARRSIQDLEAVDPTTLTEAEQDAREQMLEQAHAVIRYITKRQIEMLLASVKRKERRNG